MSHMTLAIGLPWHEFLAVQWLDYPTGELKIMGSIPIGDSGFFFIQVRDKIEHFINSMGRHARESQVLMNLRFWFLISG